MFPTIIKAAVGPHDLGPGSRDDEESPKVEAQFHSDSDSDTMSGLQDGDDDRSSAPTIDPESDIVVHNTTSVRSSLSRFLPVLITLSRPKGMISI